MTYMANCLNLHAQYAINNDIRDMQIDIIAQKLVSSSLSRYLYRPCSRLFETLVFDLLLGHDRSQFRNHCDYY